MHEFADRIGWKIQKRDEDEVREFCRDVGVDKGVLKVWMHNNKNTFSTTRRELPFSGDTTVQKIDNGVAVSGGDNIVINNNSNNNADDVGVHGGNGLEHEIHRGGGDGRFESDSGGAAANGSSSTS
ncbi:hypothetical protein Rs2_14865 [Raphanus sativus]|nr:hypothetical protein Rs2_14865 [Raphanus sativus]